jgi:MFS superfamily sulfate permease-like transporter
VRPNVLLVDVGIAIVAAIVILTITPGLAVASMIAIAVLIACAFSYRRESRRRRGARDARRRTARPAGRAGSPSTRRNNRA